VEGEPEAGDAPLALKDAVVRRGRWRLGPVTWCAQPGVTALVGANGAGKSTFLDLASGRLRPRAGKVTSTGRVAHLPQHVDFPFGVTARDCVEFAAAMTSPSGIDLQSAATQALSSVDLVSASGMVARKLSGGQQRRLAVAQIIVDSPPVIVLDEPFAGLDPLQRDALVDWIVGAGTRASVVVAMHDVEVVEQMADQLLVLADGEIAYAGRVDALSLDGGISTVPEAIRSLMQQPKVAS